MQVSLGSSKLGEELKVTSGESPQMTRTTSNTPKSKLEGSKNSKEDELIEKSKELARKLGNIHSDILNPSKNSNSGNENKRRELQKKLLMRQQTLEQNLFQNFVVVAKEDLKKQEQKMNEQTKKFQDDQNLKEANEMKKIVEENIEDFSTEKTTEKMVNFFFFFCFFFFFIFFYFSFYFFFYYRKSWHWTMPLIVFLIPSKLILIREEKRSTF